ncbi:hypothetical protein L2E82_50687 [Cichorium intybus]|nr:hypothetical protein L2E82_50687 [Cichorium intybus]
MQAGLFGGKSPITDEQIKETELSVSFPLGLVRFLFGLRLSSFHFHRIRFFVSLHLCPYITCEQESGLYYCIQRDLHQTAAKLGTIKCYLAIYDDS